MEATVKAVMEVFYVELRPNRKYYRMADVLERLIGRLIH